MAAIKLFIGGFPLEMDEMQLAQLVSPHGEISTMKIVRDKVTKICKGYPFIEMKSEANAVEVMAALDGEMIGDRQLSVRLAAEPIAPAPPPAKTGYTRVERNTVPIKKKRPRL